MAERKHEGNLFVQFFVWAIIFWTSSSLKGKRGNSFTCGGLMLFAGFVCIQPLSWQKREKARRRSSSLDDVRGDNILDSRNVLVQREMESARSLLASI